MYNLLEKDSPSYINCGIVVSGDRVITSRYTESPKDGKNFFKVEVYDLMTDFVIFSVTHHSNYPFKLFASGRLLVVVENYDESLPYVSDFGKGRTILTVYERINDGTVEKSTIDSGIDYQNVILSQDNSVIAFINEPDHGAVVFIKEHGFFNFSEVDVYLSDKWLILRNSPPNREGHSWSNFNIIAIELSTQLVKRLFINLDAKLQVSGSLLTWARREGTMHIVQMVDLSQKVFTVKTLGALPCSYFHDSPIIICPFGDFKKTRMMIAIGGHGAVAILNVDKRTFAFACPAIMDSCTTIPTRDSPLVLRFAPFAESSITHAGFTVIRLKSSLTPDDSEGPSWHADARAMFVKKMVSLDGQVKSSLMPRYKRSARHAKIHDDFTKKATLARILHIFLQYLPVPKTLPPDRSICWKTQNRLLQRSTRSGWI